MLEELSGKDGPGRTERQILYSIDRGVGRVGPLFARVSNMEQAVFLGDWRFFAILSELGFSDAPPILGLTERFQPALLGENDRARASSLPLGTDPTRRCGSCRKRGPQRPFKESTTVTTRLSLSAYQRPFTSFNPNSRTTAPTVAVISSPTNPAYSTIWRTSNSQPPINAPTTPIMTFMNRPDRFFMIVPAIQPANPPMAVPIFDNSNPFHK